MGKFFTVDVKPDIINGDISDIKAAGAPASTGNTDVGAGDLIFDWTAVDVPKGGCMLRSVTAIVNAEDAAYGAGSLTDYHLIFAKSIKGEAPTSMGVTNGAQTGGFDLGGHHVGSMVIESTAATGTLSNTAFHVVYHSSDNSATGGGLPLVIDLDPASGTNVGYDKLYVCGFQLAARHYCTAVTVDGAITSDTATTITVADMDATKIFSKGDTVYLHDVDTALGTVKSVSATSIELNAAIAGGTNLDDDDELVNANPIKIKLGFEQ